MAAMAAGSGGDQWGLHGQRARRESTPAAAAREQFSRTLAMAKKARITVSTTMLMMTTMAIIMVTGFFGRLPCALAYTAADFINAYKDPTVAKIEVPNDLVLTESLPPISRPLSIIGVGAKRPVVSGGKRFSGINTTSALTLTNLELKDFLTSSPGQGAVVFSDGDQDTVIHRCVFRDNVGGAIAFTGGGYHFTIVGSLCVGNRAPSAYQSGGALSATLEGGGSITDTEFHNNYAKERGGAVDVRVGTKRIERCKFVGNRADGPGGGGLSCSRASCIISSSQFLNNVAKGMGGGLRFWSDGEGITSVCTGNSFSRNSALNDSRSADVYVELVDASNDSYPVVHFCDPTPPPSTLLNAPNGTVVFNDCGEC
ncbi:hypothetical protein CBR_g73035 [Chara braunii]|uniref:Right handed beta helix domain-containing protein n=1 Tax=Chara braunii TaxID=69332 RepID=A0A388MG54_CHABU|nr:hypothetical protein CBR_g73035 [Chara braunii]|eukprot:GBG93524.1 hypothetical protein CBR_g73035 [Chara braunii]